MTSDSGLRTTKVVVATTVMLSFISFWRAAAIVLSDLASSAYYAGGIAEAAIGKAAPWFIFGIMLFSYAVRAVYIESCSIFVRGGVYKVVNTALGPRLAKFSVSALMFDYVLTGPISAVSAGLYIAGLINETAEQFHVPWAEVDPRHLATVFALIVTFYFWRKNIIGIHESSEKALRIMQLTTVMVVILLTWCVVTILKNGYSPVPLPTPSNMRLTPESLGWLHGTWLSSVTVVAVLVGLGHSLLAMSGEETLAQVNREIAHPKLKNLERAGFVIFVYSLLFTSLVSFFAVMLIPDAERPKFLDNLIGGLSMHLVGPLPARLLFHVFVVVVGTLLLAGAVNTAIIGSNGVLNRVAEDGVLAQWFRHPHCKFGTTHRIINTVAVLQLVTILLSHGDVELLGQAYAFGVVWSFSMNALSMLVLRYKLPEGREWKVPLNFRLGRREVPVGLALITLALFALATANVLTKKVATISGAAFTVAFYIVFTISEAHSIRRRSREEAALERFRLDAPDLLAPDTVRVRPGNVLVAVRNPHKMDHFQRVLDKTDTRRVDVVAVSVRTISPSGSGGHEMEVNQIFSVPEIEVFSKVVELAEKAGKHVELLVVPGVDPYEALVQTAQRLESARIVTGLSPKLTPAEQGKLVGHFWEQLPEPRPTLSLEIALAGEDRSAFFNLGPHPPRLWPEDVDRLHRLWLELSSRDPDARLHHRDVVGAALRRLENELQSPRANEVVEEVLRDASGDVTPPS